MQPVALCAILTFFCAPTTIRAAALTQLGAEGVSIPFKLAPLPELRNASAHAKDTRRQIYVLPVSVAGETFELILDTGSSDLWVDTSALPSGILAAPELEDTGIPIKLDYGLNGSDTSARGTAQLANVHLKGSATLENVVVRDQAFVNVPGAPAVTQYGNQGILGLGATLQWSVIQHALSGLHWNGQTFLHNMFKQNPNLEDMFTIEFGPRDDAGVVQGGTFSIGNHGARILDMPKLPLVTGRIWDVHSRGFLVDGVPLDVPSSLLEARGMMLDTGAFAACIPPEYLRAIYSPVNGSFLLDDGSWSVPCDTKMNVSVTFGDVAYPIHPLDMTEVYDVRDGTPMCRSLFKPNADTRIPFLIGLNVLRNTHLLYHYATLSEFSSTAPYVQVLGITDVEKASEEFDAMNKARIEAFIATTLSAATPAPPSTLDEIVVGLLRSPKLSHQARSLRGLAEGVFAVAACLVVVLFVFRCHLRLAKRKSCI